MSRHHSYPAEQTCEVCGEKFSSYSAVARTCSDRCRQRKRRAHIDRERARESRERGDRRAAFKISAGVLAVVLALLFVSCGPPRDLSRVECIGPHEITCDAQCVQSCFEESADAGPLVGDANVVALFWGDPGCNPRCTGPVFRADADGGSP